MLIFAIAFSIATGWVPPANAGTLIRIRGGAIQVERGPLRADAKTCVEEILREAGASEGWIAILGETEVIFSRRIPVTIHQQLRNVLLNQWS